jgi:hypothetical protein
VLGVELIQMLVHPDGYADAGPGAAVCPRRPLRALCSAWQELLLAPRELDPRFTNAVRAAMLC